MSPSLGKRVWKIITDFVQVNGCPGAMDTARHCIYCYLYTYGRKAKLISAEFNNEPTKAIYFNIRCLQLEH
jgi:hypothetical protein